MERKDYQIDILNLKNGTYNYNFNIKDEFFEFFDNSIVNKARLEIEAVLEKSERLIRVIFILNGTVKLVCDRSLKEFDHSMDGKFEHLFKYSEYGEDDTEDITHISPNTESVDLGQLIYEYIVVGIPMKKIHPDHRNEEDSNDFFYKTEVKEEKNSKEDIDPRWEALKNLNK